MVQHTVYHVDGTAALRPEEVACLRVYEGGADRGRSASSLHRGAHKVILAALAVTLTIACALGVCAVDSLREASANQAIDAAPKEVVSVTSGDSLWSIAETHPVRGASTRSVVSWIMANNGLSTPSIQVGDALVVPVLRT